MFWVLKCKVTGTCLKSLNDLFHFQNKQAVMQKHQKNQLDILQTDLKRLGQLSTKAQATPHAVVAASFSSSNGKSNPRSVARPHIAVPNNTHRQ